MKKLFWLVLLVLFAAYCYIVWGWIQEGNENFRIDREHCQQFADTAYDAIPAGCRQYFDKH